MAGVAPVVTLTRVLLLDQDEGTVVAERRMVPLVSTDGRVTATLAELFPKHAAECHRLHGAIEVSGRDRFIFPRGAPVEWFEFTVRLLDEAQNKNSPRTG
jgi:hypothetical protein